MKKYFALLTIVFCQFNLMAQNCADFESFESSQNWIKELNNLDSESRKDSILNRIKCERFFRANDIEHFETIFLVYGYTISNVPEYRDSLLNRIKADSLELFENRVNAHKHHGIKGHRLGFLTISGLNKPIIDNIETLTVQKVERIVQTEGQKTIGSRISINLKSEKSQEFIFKIEDFENKDSYTTEKIYLKKGRKTVDFSVENTVKVITITDSENNLITIIR